MSDERVLRFLLEVGVNPQRGTPRFEEFRTALANHTRRAIAAYEAEQSTPDPERCYREFERAYSRAENNGGDWVARVDAGLAAVLAHLKGETR